MMMTKSKMLSLFEKYRDLSLIEFARLMAGMM